MTKSTEKFWKGMGLGLLVGGVAMIVGDCCLQPQKQQLMNSVKKAVHQFGNAVEDVEDAL